MCAFTPGFSFDYKLPLTCCLLFSTSSKSALSTISTAIFKILISTKNSSSLLLYFFTQKVPGNEHNSAKVTVSLWESSLSLCFSHLVPHFHLRYTQNYLYHPCICQHADLSQVRHLSKLLSPPYSSLLGSVITVIHKAPPTEIPNSASLCHHSQWKPLSWLGLVV